MRKKINKEKEMNTQKKMSFKRKLLEVVIQIAMLPYSALTTVSPFLIISIIFVILSVGAFFWEAAFLETVKNYEASEVGSKTYHVEPSLTFRQEGDSVVAHYDNGERTTFSPSERIVILLTFLALPLRVISLILSILALMIPRLNIKLKNNEQTYWNLFLDVAYMD